MAGLWDTSLKRLVGAMPQDFVSWLEPGARFVIERSPHMKRRNIDMDILLEVRVYGRRMLLHIEFQSYRDANMGKRLWEYNVLATCYYGCPVRSFVIYLKKGVKTVESPHRVYLPGGEEVHLFHFKVVKMWSILKDALKRTGLVGLLPLLSLTQDGGRPEVVQEAIEGILANSGEATSELLSVTYLLASLAFKKPVDQDWLNRRFAIMRDILRNTPAYKQLQQWAIEDGHEEARKRAREELHREMREELRREMEAVRKAILEQGLQQGLQQGRLQGQREALVGIVQARFPALETMAQAVVDAIQDLEALRLLTIRISVVQDEEDARRALTEAQAGRSRKRKK